MIPLSEVLRDNHVFRYDTQYFSKAALATEALIKQGKWNELVDLADSVESFGAYALTNEFTYQEQGIPFLRCVNIRGGFADFGDVLYINAQANKLLAKSEVKPGMLLLTMSGSVGNAAVALDTWNYPINSNQDIAKVAPKSGISPFYVAAFLGSKFGQIQMERLPVGSVQQHIFLWMIERLVVARLSPNLEEAIGGMVRKAYQCEADCVTIGEQAEQTLLRALGLEGWEPPEPLTYTRRASEALAAARFDAEYFAPRVAHLLAKLSADGLTIHDVAPARHESFDPKAPKARLIPAQGNALGMAAPHGEALKGRPKATAGWDAPSGLNDLGDTSPGAWPQAGMGRAVGPESIGDQAGPADDAPADTFHYIEIGGMRSDGTATSEVVPLAEAPSRANQKVHKNDIITSTVRPIRRLSAIVAPEQHEHVCSSGFVVLEPKAIAPEVLLTYLRLPVVCELMDLHTSASLYPAISERDVLKLPIPRIPTAASQTIISHIRAAHAARHEARGLLERAKRAVEIAIEQGEAAALTLLDRN